MAAHGKNCCRYLNVESTRSDFSIYIIGETGIVAPGRLHLLNNVHPAKHVFTIHRLRSHELEGRSKWGNAGTGHLHYDRLSYPKLLWSNLLNLFLDFQQKILLVGISEAGRSSRRSSFRVLKSRASEHVTNSQDSSPGGFPMYTIYLMLKTVQPDLDKLSGAKKPSPEAFPGPYRDAPAWPVARRSLDVSQRVLCEYQAPKFGQQKIAPWQPSDD